MEGDELQQQLSRKVAQLTRVIFQLNVQLEENEAYTRAVSGAYEQEVEEIILGANQKLQQCAQLCEEEQKHYISAKEVESMLTQLRETTERVRKEAEDYRRECDESLKNSQAQQALRVQTLEDEVVRYKEEVEICTLQLRNALKHLKDNADKIRDLRQRERLGEDLANQIKEKDEQIYRLQEKLYAANKQKAGLQLLFEEAQTTRDSRGKELETAATKVEALEAALDLMKKQHEEAKHLHAETQAGYERKLQELAATNSSFFHLIDKQKKTISDYQATISGYKDMVKTEAEEKAKLERELQEYQTKVVLLTDRAAERDRDIHMQGNEVINELQRRLESSEEQADEHLKKISALQEALEAAERQNAEMKASLDKSRDEKSALENEALPTLLAEKQRLEAEVEESNKLKALYAEAQIKYVKLEQHLEAARLENKELEASLRLQVSTSETEKRDLLERQSEALQSFSIERAQQQDEIKLLKDQLLKLRQKNADQQRLLDDTTKDETISQLRTKLLKFERDFTRAQEDIAELTGRLKRTEDETTDLILKHDAEVSGLRSKMEELLRGRAEAEMHMRKMQVESKKELSQALEQEEHLKKDIDKMQVQIELEMQKVTALTARVEELNEEKRRLQEQGEELLALARKTHAAEQQQLQQQLQEAKLEHERHAKETRSELQAAEQRHKEHIEKMEKAERELMAEQKKLWEKTTIDRLACLSEQHQMKLQETEERCEGKLRALRGDHEKQQSHLRASLLEEAATERGRFQAEIAQLSAQGAELAKDIEEKNLACIQKDRAIESLEQQKASLSRSLEERNEEIAQMRERHTHELEKVQSVYEKDKEQVQSLYEQQLAAIKAEHEQSIEAKNYEIQFFQDEHRRALSAAKKETERLRNALADCPSNTRDLQEIESLSKRLQQTESHAEALQAKLQICKRELANRERNYNHIFNANPVTGVLDPIDVAKPPALQRGSSNASEATSADWSDAAPAALVKSKLALTPERSLSKAMTSTELSKKKQPHSSNRSGRSSLLLSP